MLAPARTIFSSVSVAQSPSSSSVRTDEVGIENFPAALGCTESASTAFDNAMDITCIVSGWLGLGGPKRANDDCASNDIAWNDAKWYSEQKW